MNIAALLKEREKVAKRLASLDNLIKGYQEVFGGEKPKGVKKFSGKAAKKTAAKTVKTTKKTDSNLTNEDLITALEQVGPLPLDALVETLQKGGVKLGAVPARLVAVKAAHLVKKGLLTKNTEGVFEAVPTPVTTVANSDIAQEEALAAK